MITGPAESHGGFTPDEKVWVRVIQRQLIRKGYVPGVTDPMSGWADGVFEQPTADAVTRFQKSEMPGTTFYGQVWADDFTGHPPGMDPVQRAYTGDLALYAKLFDQLQTEAVYGPDARRLVRQAVPSESEQRAVGLAQPAR